MRLSRGSSAPSSGAVVSASVASGLVLSIRLRFFFSTIALPPAANCGRRQDRCISALLGNDTNHARPTRVQCGYSTFFFFSSNLAALVFCLTLSLSSAGPVEHSPFSLDSTGCCVSSDTSFALSDTFSLLLSALCGWLGVGDGGASHNGGDAFSGFLAATYKSR